MRIRFTGQVSRCSSGTSKANGKPYHKVEIQIPGATIQGFPKNPLSEGDSVTGSLVFSFDSRGGCEYRVEFES